MHLPLLRWARARGCARGAATCSAAARGGSLAVLQWCQCDAPPFRRGQAQISGRLENVTHFLHIVAATSKCAVYDYSSSG
jgi:hypothetical protein